jgi:hypothetical protein
LKASKKFGAHMDLPMNRAAQTTRLLGRRFGQSVSSALLHILPPNLSSWKLALYVIVFLLPGGSFVVLGAAWFENRQMRKSAKPAATVAKPLLCSPKRCDA